MIDKYSYLYFCNTGKTYRNSCICSKMYCFYWKAKKRIPCSDCDKPISSAYGQYPLHIRDYYVIQFYDSFDQRSKKELMSK